MKSPWYRMLTANTEPTPTSTELIEKTYIPPKSEKVSGTLATDLKVSDIVKTIETHKNEIAKHRDALRDLFDDLESVIESCDTAEEELESAIQTLSQYL